MDLGTPLYDSLASILRDYPSTLCGWVCLVCVCVEFVECVCVSVVLLSCLLAVLLSCCLAVLLSCFLAVLLSCC